MGGWLTVRDEARKYVIFFRFEGKEGLWNQGTPPGISFVNGIWKASFI
jgi:hypothetical protein